MTLNLDALVLAPAFATFGEVNRGFPVPVYTPQSGAPFGIDGVFREPSATELAAGDAIGLTTPAPQLDIRASQVPAGVTIAQKDQVAVRGNTYWVKDVRPDGNGLLTLTLNLASAS